MVPDTCPQLWTKVFLSRWHLSLIHEELGLLTPGPPAPPAAAMLLFQVKTRPVDPRAQHSSSANVRIK